ncbi:MAG: nucleoside 2-deoxyribosyltransferase [Christensenellaceae bacterium]
MKFYIASKLKNHKQVQYLAQKLKAAGWHQTFDWTNYLSAKPMDERSFMSLGQKEVDGVKNADVVIVLTPQGRGTHVELGMAIALGKIIYLCHTDDAYFKCDNNTSSFYWLPQVKQLIGTIAEIAETILCCDHTI